MSLGHGSSIVKTQLVSYLDFANLKSYSGSGTDVVDLAGNNKLSDDFSIVGSGHSYSTNNNGYWSSSGNQGNYLEAGTQTFGDFGYNSFTYQFFIRPQASTSIDNAAYARIAETSNWPDSWYLMAIIHNSGSRYVNFSGASYDGSTTTWDVSTSSGSVSLNEWYFLTFIFDRTSSTPYGKIYINDTLSANAALSTAITTNDTPTAYMRYPSSYAEMQADYGAVLTYKKSLTEDEIKTNFEALRGRYGI